MLRRRLFALLLCLVAAGLPLAAEAMSAGIQAEHASMQDDDGMAIDCSSGMALGACGMHCAAGACVVAMLCSQPLSVASAQPVSSEKTLTPAGRSAPDTAPPRPALA
jgi:hypothetical protein